MNTASHRSNEHETTSLPIGSDPIRSMIPRSTRWLALGAVAGPILFTLVWFILGFLSRGYILYGILIAPYSPISQPISGLGLGLTAPFMNTAFVLCGLLQLVGVVGIFQGIPEMSPFARWSCAALFALSSLGFTLDGIFTLESGSIHYLGFMLADSTAILGFLAAGLLLRRVPRWQKLGSLLIWAGPVTLLLTVVFFLTFNPVAAGAGLGVAGLTERLLVIELQAWFAIPGWLIFKYS